MSDNPEHLVRSASFAIYNPETGEYEALAELKIKASDLIFAPKQPTDTSGHLVGSFSLEPVSITITSHCWSWQEFNAFKRLMTPLWLYQYERRKKRREWLWRKRR